VGLWFLGVFLGPLLMRVGLAGGQPPIESDLPDTGEEDDVPLEWLGIDRPFTSTDVAALDRAIGLETQGSR
jgi:hypothetical protein